MSCLNKFGSSHHKPLAPHPRVAAILFSMSTWSFPWKSTWRVNPDHWSTRVSSNPCPKDASCEWLESAWVSEVIFNLHFSGSDPAEIHPWPSAQSGCSQRTTSPLPGKCSMWMVQVLNMQITSRQLYYNYIYTVIIWLQNIIEWYITLSL